MKHPVSILPRAERDFLNIYSYIGRRTSVGALRWRAAFEQAVEKLTHGPYRYGFAPENQWSNYELRQFLFKTPRGHTYRGVYTIVSNEIRILRLRGPGQPPLSEEEIADE